MKIEQVTINNFKRFVNSTFDLADPTIIAGPNDAGKTTLLQAIATWHLALKRWKDLDDYHCHGGEYTKAPIARQAFYPVPLRTFDMLWHERTQWRNIEITLRVNGVDVAVEIHKDSTEQVYVRPSNKVEYEWLKDPNNLPKPIFVPAMTGLSVEEPVYQQPKINQLLGQGKPGDVLRNILALAYQDQDVWDRLQHSVRKILHYKLLPPDTSGPHIIVEYQVLVGETRYDIASADSGFHQVLMLLAFLHTYREVVLMVDEPDAHLPVRLQGLIYNELRENARENNSQLIIATHSERIIDVVEPKDICVLPSETPRKLAYDKEQNALLSSLTALSNMDMISARQEGKVIYTESYTDIDILRAWARVLNHPIKNYLQNPFWKPTVFEAGYRKPGIKADDHFEALQIVEENILGVQIVGREGNLRIPDHKILYGNLLRLCWARYEATSYLVHPVALARFISKISREDATAKGVESVIWESMPSKAYSQCQSLEDHPFLVTTKARARILSWVFSAYGLSDFSSTCYWEIAEAMLPEEIHPEIIEKLDAIADHLKL